MSLSFAYWVLLHIVGSHGGALSSVFYQESHG